MNTALSDFDELARRRRTSLLIDVDKPVPPELIMQLCELATWAPNHKRTWPWRFSVLTGDARVKLGALTREQLLSEGEKREGKLAKALTKYCRASTIVMVAAAHQDEPEVLYEDHLAVAAGIQNFLLGATAAGLASFWASGAPLRSDAVRELCGFEPTDHMIALIYLGWPTDGVLAPQRPEPTVTFVE
ncbi:MAG: nitroreductase [Acidimicrobiia bacterium]